MLRLHVLLALGLCPLLAFASDPAPATPPAAPKPGAACVAGHFREFDFWVGQWDVYGPKGKLVGHSRIEKILGDCVIAEHWQGSGGSDGKSHNIYDALKQRWSQYWVDNSGMVLELHGGIEQGSMVLKGTSAAANGAAAAVQRITWTPQSDGRVRQLWETSTDNGTSWTTAFDGWYQTAGSPPPSAPAAG